MKPIVLAPNKVEGLVLACVTLHNLMRSKSAARAVYNPPGSFDHEDIDGTRIVPGSWRNDEEARRLIPLGFEGHGKPQLAAKSIRDELCDYFNSPERSVPWQWQMVQ